MRGLTNRRERLSNRSKGLGTRLATGLSRIGSWAGPAHVDEREEFWVRLTLWWIMESKWTLPISDIGDNLM